MVKSFGSYCNTRLSFAVEMVTSATAIGPPIRSLVEFPHSRMDRPSRSSPANSSAVSGKIMKVDEPVCHTPSRGADPQVRSRRPRRLLDILPVTGKTHEISNTVSSLPYSRQRLCPNRHLSQQHPQAIGRRLRLLEQNPNTAL